MIKRSKIIIIGLCPSWDTTCRLDGIEWGQHRMVSSIDSKPAGKALNISRAFAWMGTKTITTGLWGQQDYQQMIEAISPLTKFVKIGMTKADGATRQNITIVDTVKKREMHLRSESELASKKSLRKLKADLEKIVSKGSVCVFAGAMPEEKLLDDVVGIINFCRKGGAKVVLDTSGLALKRIVNSGSIWLVKPNVEELRELLGEQVKDTITGLVKAGRELLDKVKIVLISRGKKGSIAVTKEGVWQGRCVATDRKVLSTVGCGDYLLAGFLKGLRDKSDAGLALETAIKVATAKAWGWTESKRWVDVERRIRVEVGRM